MHFLVSGYPEELRSFETCGTCTSTVPGLSWVKKTTYVWFCECFFSRSSFQGYFGVTLGCPHTKKKKYMLRDLLREVLMPSLKRRRYCHMPRQDLPKFSITACYAQGSFISACGGDFYCSLFLPFTGTEFLQHLY